MDTKPDFFFRCLYCVAYLAELGISFCNKCTTSKAENGLRIGNNSQSCCDGREPCCDGREPSDATSTTRVWRCDAAVSGTVVVDGMTINTLPASCREVIQKAVSVF